MDGLELTITLTLEDWSAYRAATGIKSTPNGAWLGPSVMRFDASGIGLQTASSYSHADWSLLKNITRTARHLFFWTDNAAAYVVPVRDLPAGLSAEACIERIRQLAALQPTNAHPSPIPHLRKTRAPTSPHSLSPIRTIGRLIALRQTEVVSATSLSIAVVALTVIGLWIAYTHRGFSVDARFYPYELADASWYVLLVLACSGLLALLAGAALGYAQALFIVVVLIGTGIVAWAALEALIPTRFVGLALIPLGVYVWTYLNRALRSATGRTHRWAVAAALLATCCGAWVTERLYIFPIFWEEPKEIEQREDYASAWRESESLLFGQADKIDALAAQMQRPENLRAAAFFIGFAGVGEQRVFAGEISLAERVIAGKYGSAARSLKLVNDQRDLNSLPLASPTALRRALLDVGKRMDREHDVLFLSLSSHGSKDGTISVSNGTLPIVDLTSQELATALQQAGIRWRVLIVSACYAGTFIEPLRDERTIIIAASAADRNSFGCSNDRDLTYFGEAFYRDSLREAGTLRAAFDKASASIERRESDEHIKHSKPQAFFGKEIEPYLEQLAHPGLTSSPAADSTPRRRESTRPRRSS